VALINFSQHASSPGLRVHYYAALTISSQAVTLKTVIYCKIDVFGPYGKEVLANEHTVQIIQKKHERIL